MFLLVSTQFGFFSCWLSGWCSRNLGPFSCWFSGWCSGNLGLFPAGFLAGVQGWPLVGSFFLMVGWCSGLVGAVFPDSMRETSASISLFGQLAPFGVVACCSLVLFCASAWFSDVVDVVVDFWLLVVGCWLLIFLVSQNPI